MVRSLSALTCLIMVPPYERMVPPEMSGLNGTERPGDAKNGCLEVVSQSAIEIHAAPLRGRPEPSEEIAELRQGEGVVAGHDRLVAIGGIAVRQQPLLPLARP